ncbi:MAG: DUF736 family protein [Sphingomonadales bacterium]|nr:DUF736 family protein [Sphingomonadales bacterium]
MNIGTGERNMSGQLIGSIATIGLCSDDRPAPRHQQQPQGPMLDIVALNAQRQWVVVGALFELAMNATGEVFHQGKIDDPSMDQPLYIAMFAKGDGEYAIAWQRPKRRNTEIGTSDYRDSDLFGADAGDDDAGGDGLGESTAAPPKRNGRQTAKTDQATTGSVNDSDPALPPLVDA